MIGNIVGGAVGGATAALVLRLLEKEASTLGVAYERPVRRYRGYPSDTATEYAAGNAEFVIGPPNGYGWEILGIMWDVRTAAASLPEIDVLRRCDGAVVLPALMPPAGAGLTSFYYFMQGASYELFTVAGVAQGCVLPLPLNGELRDEDLHFVVNAGGIGDLQRIFIYYEEFRL
jgi:hypothetical protein